MDSQKPPVRGRGAGRCQGTEKGRGTGGAEKVRGTGGTERGRGTGGAEKSGGIGGTEKSGGTGGREKAGGIGGTEKGGGTGGREKAGGTGGREKAGGTGGREKAGGTGGMERGRGTGGAEKVRGTGGTEKGGGVGGTERGRGTGGAEKSGGIGGTERGRGIGGAEKGGGIGGTEKGGGTGGAERGRGTGGMEKGRGTGGTERGRGTGGTEKGGGTGGTEKGGGTGGTERSRETGGAGRGRGMEKGNQELEKGRGTEGGRGRGGGTGQRRKEGNEKRKHRPRKNPYYGKPIEGLNPWDLANSSVMIAGTGDACAAIFVRLHGNPVPAFYYPFGNLPDPNIPPALRLLRVYPVTRNIVAPFQHLTERERDSAIQEVGRYIGSLSQEVFDYYIMSAQTAAVAGIPPQLFKGIVKQALSGDSIIIRGQPKGGPPPERQLNFSNIIAPRLARRPGGPGAKPDDGKDEPWAWESREFVRKKLVGKEVTFVVDYKVPSSGREYGTVYLGKDTETGENITEEIVKEGLASVRKEGKADTTKLVELEEQAKAANRGKWGPDSEKHVREIIWQVDNPRQLLDKFGRKPVAAVVEHVRDGSTIRAFLLPSFHYVTLMMSGIRSPGVKLDAEGKPDPNSKEPFSEEAKFFTESRLLQRDVEIILESVNNANLVGSIIHPNGNIAELLLKDGFARCIDWSMGFVTGGAEKLRSAEKFAKEKKLRIWRDYQASASNNAAAGLKGKDKEFVATVTECVNGDALVVRLADGSSRKVFLASIRPPRLSDENKDAENKEKSKPMRPLYDIPFMFEAREYLRKKLIGKKVNVTVDYIQPPSQSFPEKVCCTVKHEGANIAEALVSKGFVTVVRYRQDDDQRASEYDSLLAAEARAQKAAKGLHGKEIPVHHVVDLSGDAAKAKQFLPYLQRAGKITALVEYVASGSRLRLFVPRETRLITFLLAGISCPRAGRAAGGTGPAVEGEPYGEEALAFTKEMCHQREVEIEVDSIDKAGNFIGFLWIDNKNLSVSLVEEGLSTVHFSAERTPYYRQLQIAEGNAKARKAKVWQNFVDTVEEIKAEDDKIERKVDPKPVLVTEVTPELHIYVQFTEEGDKLEALMNDLRRELNEKPPLTGAYTPKKGELCVARYSGDGEWYRARVDKILPDGEVSVVFVDYGNRENVKASKCAALPPIAAASLPPFAREYALACVSLPSDEDFAAEAIHAVRHDTADGVFLLNVEYKVGGLDYVTLADKTSKEDVAQNLVKEGLLLVENKKERRLQKLLKDYKAAEEEAKTKHLCIWQYGDITEDDAREFGMGR